MQRSAADVPTPRTLRRAAAAAAAARRDGTRIDHRRLPQRSHRPYARPALMYDTADTLGSAPAPGAVGVGSGRKILVLGKRVSPRAAAAGTGAAVVALVLVIVSAASGSDSPSGSPAAPPPPPPAATWDGGEWDATFSDDALVVDSVILVGRHGVRVSSFRHRPLATGVRKDSSRSELAPFAHRLPTHRRMDCPGTPVSRRTAGSGPRLVVLGRTAS